MNIRAFEEVELQDTVDVERWARDLYFCYRPKDSYGTHRLVNMINFMSCP